MNFFDKNYLLKNETGQKLYYDYAAKMPIIDYHCHLDPKAIYENGKFESITEAWIVKNGAGDHYKWRLMRAAGFDESYITGDKSSFQKFEAFAKTLKYAIGNPIYHWAHMELKFFFGIEEPLSEENAKEIYEKANEKIKNMTVRDFIEKSNVEVIVTTDDPLDALEWHAKIKEDTSFKTRVLPGFRPDNVVNIENSANFIKYVEKLDANDLQSLEIKLKEKIEHFAKNGCLAADHGLEYVPFIESETREVDSILKRALKGEILNKEEIDKYKTHMLKFFAALYKEKDWVMEFHYGALRNINKPMFDKLGPDTGYDTIGDDLAARNLKSLLGYLKQHNKLPKTLLFSINPNDIYMLGVLMAGFNDIESEMQLGPPWWFNDHRNGIETQINALADVGLLGKHIGMLTDSRSFLSYVRHEYHRRITCSIIGEWIEQGEFYQDIEIAGKLVQDIAYNNAVRYFGF
ncbi:MAG: glucuronate isomerase [Defluviitaleaceae bacterium]|nr:glucuronate isomerase [Defluviitaleaceae bacterium]